MRTLPLSVEQMKKKIDENKLFLYMVVHDMRSPTVSIKLGLDRTKDVLEEIKAIIKGLEEQLKQPPREEIG